MTSTTDTVVVTDLWAANKGHSKTNSLSSNIPTLRGTPGPSTSASRLTSSPQKSPQKLRLQSPQKLRERLQNEAKAIGEAEASLQSELSKIGEEMAKLNTASSARASDLDKLSRKIAALEGRIPEVVKELQSQNEQSKLELEKSLQASEIKVKGLDQLYKESSAENELLYEKFNAELGKIVKALKGKGKEDKEELVGKLKESSEETAKTKKENARLRRELLTLRALLKANE
jgi:septal ring factor EnvC (AmiA/AmiB activator)